MRKTTFLARLRAALPAVVLAGTAVTSLSLAPPPAYTQPATEDAKLTAFLDAEFDQELALRPQLATRLARKEGMDRLDDISEAGQLKLLEWRRGSVARLKEHFDRAKLSPTLQISYDMWVLELERAELTYKFRRYQPPFYSFLYSVHSELPNFLINTHTVSDPNDMVAYNARLGALPSVLDVAIEESRLSAAEHIRAPRFEYERVISGSRTLISGAPFDDSGKDSPLWADAKAKVAKLEAAGKVAHADAETLLTGARNGILSLRPAYERVIAWAEKDIADAPAGRVGAVSLPGGLDWYAAALKLNTTTDLTADQVHALGLTEVARIEQEQDRLARSAGVADRHAYYAERTRLYPPAPWTDERRADYLRRANELLAATREKLPAWFGLLPQFGLEVVREPVFSEVAGGAAHSAAPSPDGVRPARVYVHLLGMTDDPANLYYLMCHEGLPGHALQSDITARRKGTPRFHTAYRYVAHGEGWGLYSEALCKEMGVYPDVAADFMRLDAELFRAARLVVDTGIHAKGWTENQAIDYMIQTGRRPPDQARAEVRRYITLPGQATGYKIGMLKIMALRRKAARVLGASFDIKAFHDVVVGSGSLPLSVLERRVDEWVAEAKR